MKILFSEGSSLTAREFLSVLGPRGHWIEIADANPLCICRFSHWAKRFHRCPPPGRDPSGYLEAINRLLVAGNYDVLLPTHEQAWLFAAARESLSPSAGIAVASADAFSRVQSKIAFAQLLDEVGLPQPEWGLANSSGELDSWQPPYYLKAPFSTAGSGVRCVRQQGDSHSAFESLRASYKTGPIMVQAPARGHYAQVQALFDHGRLVAAHTSSQTAVGIGPSAAGRVSVDHPFARRDMVRVGEHLNWHGGLTLDYFFCENDRAYIECNPRTVEPANSAASGVDLPGLQLALSLGCHPEEVPIGKVGVRTHGALAILLGTAAYEGTRRAVLAEALRLLLGRSPGQGSRECLTPVSHDWLSGVPLIEVFTRVMFDPRSAERMGSAAIRAYSLSPEAMTSQP